MKERLEIRDKLDKLKQVLKRNSNPTYRQINELWGYPHQQSVCRMLNTLESRGYITRKIIIKRRTDV